MHDSTIYNRSELKTYLEENFDPENPRFCLGDKGYACSSVMITPFRQNQHVEGVDDQQLRDYNRGELFRILPLILD